MSARLLLLTQWFDPEPTFKGLLFAKELARRGFEVEVVTGFPNYPGGKVYPGYKVRWLRRESVDGVRVTRVPLYPSHDRSVVGRVLNYGTFALSALIYCAFFARRPSVIYAYHPPLTVGVAAVLIRFIRRVPVVYDLQDIWPDTLRATEMVKSPTILNIVGRVCRWVYRHVDQLVVLSPGFKRLLAARGVPAEKVEVIYNWCDETAVAGATGSVPTAFPGADQFRILFAGNIGKAQALETVLTAAEILRDQSPRVTFVLMGAGVEVEHLKQAARAKNLDNVVFLGPVPMAEVGAALKAADALLVHLRKDELFTITIPSKTQAYMAAGRPILMAVDGDAARLVEQSGCGVLAESGNPASIASAALRLARESSATRDAMATAGQRFYRTSLSLSSGVTQFCCIFERLSGAEALR